MKKIWNSFKQKFDSLKDLAAISYSDILGAAIPAIFWLYLSSIMEVEQYGQLHYWISIASIGFMISLIGTSNVITVYTAKNIRIQPALYFISFLTGGIATVSLIIIFYKFDIGLLLLAFIINELATSYLLGKKLFVNYSKYIIIQKSFFVLLGVAFFYQFGIDGIIYGFVLSYSHFLFVIFKVFRESKIDLSLVKKHRSFIIDNYLMTATHGFRLHLDKLIIPPLLGFTILGNYTLALQIFAVLTIFENIMFKYTLTYDARGIANWKLKKFAILLSIGIALLGIFILPYIIPTFFPKYTETVDSIRIISIAVVTTTIAKIYVSKFLGLEKSRIILYGRILSVIGMVISLLILGPMFGIVGISIAFVISSAVYTSTLVYYNKKTEKSTNN